MNPNSSNLKETDPSELPVNKRKNERQEPNLNRREFLKLGGVAGFGLGIAALFGNQTGHDNLTQAQELGDQPEKHHEFDVNEVMKHVTAEIADLYPSLNNKASLTAMMAWFMGSVARGFLSESLQAKTALNNTLLDAIGKFSPTAGVSMFGAEQLRLQLLNRGNHFDHHMGEHESEEVWGSLYLVFLMAYLAHFAEQGIKMSPDADRLIKKRIPCYDIANPWQLDEAAERPEASSEENIWVQHRDKAQNDMEKSMTGLLTFSAATAVQVYPTVYGTSKFSQNSERKFMLSAYEYFIAKAHLDKKSGDEAEEWAIEEANKAYDEFFSFKLSFVDNILAGLGVDGPCIPVFIELLRANGTKGILNYYTMMLPNIIKYTAGGLGLLEAKIFGIKNGDYVSNTLKAVGDVFVNGISNNIIILVDLIRKYKSDVDSNTDAAFIMQNFVAPQNGEGGNVADRIKEYMDTRGKVVFDFDFNVESFKSELWKWTNEVVDTFAHPLQSMKNGQQHNRPKFDQTVSLANDLHAVMLERYAAIIEWDTRNPDEKRAIITALMENDPLVQVKFKDRDVGSLMDDPDFQQFVVAHMSQVFRIDSKDFQSLLKDPKDQQEKYPLLTQPDHARVVEIAVRQFAKSIRMNRKVAKPGYHPEAGREVFGALSGQLVGAAVAASAAKWLLMNDVHLDQKTTLHMQNAFAETLNQEPTQHQYPLLDVVDAIAQNQSQQRGEMSVQAASVIDEKKNNLKGFIDDYHRKKREHEDATQMHETSEKIVREMSSILASIYQIATPQEIPGNIIKILGVVAGMTPFADNIAAVIFGVSACKTATIDTYGEEMLRTMVEVPIIPGLPMTKEMTVHEAFVIMSAIPGINLGNGSLWGNGVQLGEKLHIIRAVNSRNIGDITIEEVPAKKYPVKYSFACNPYAQLPDLWTIADVCYFASRVTSQMNEANNALAS